MRTAPLRVVLLLAVFLPARGQATTPELVVDAPRPIKTYDVRESGAVGDGKTLDSPAVQKAIDAAAETGGVVQVPAGEYLCGALRLKSNVTLRLERGATLQASEDKTLFPAVRGRWEGTEEDYPSPLLFADDCQDIALVGEGTVSARVRAALLKNCRRVRIEGITFKNTHRWNLHLLYCDDVKVVRCRFETKGQNTDGIDPDSSRRVLIKDCYFNTGDDCIAIKSGKNAEGVKIGKPCEDIVIDGCVMEGGHGAVSIGSEMSGGVRRVTITNCKISGTGSGIRLKTRKGRGGYMEDIRVSDCTISDVKIGLLVDTLYKYTAGTDLIQGDAGIPSVRRLSYSNVTGERLGKAVSLHGMQERPLEDVVLKNVKLAGKSAGAMQRVRGLKISDCEIRGEDGPLRFDDVQGEGLPASP